MISQKNGQFDRSKLIQMKKLKQKNYQETMSRIEEIVLNLENEEIEMDELSAQVKEAIELIQFCKTKLKSTSEELIEALKKLEEE